MTLTTAGLVLLAASFVTAGFLSGRNERKKLHDLRLLCELVGHIGREIVYTRTELPKIYASFADTHAHRAIDCLIAADVRSALSALTLPKDLHDPLSSFFSELGSGDAAREEARCAKIAGLLEEARAKAEKEVPASVRSVRTLGICAAALLLLLFG